MTSNSQQPQHLDLVIIGHLAFDENRTSIGTQLCIGGSAYCCAVGASILSPEKVGVVATVGLDFDISAVTKLGINMNGIVVTSSGPSARFVITQFQDNSRTFEAEWGVAQDVNLRSFPDSYALARHFHLASTPPEQQLVWLEELQKLPGQRKISVDIFEHFVRVFPEATKQVVDLADVVFMNIEEARLLGLDESKKIDKPHVLKRGEQGAQYIDATTLINEPASPVEAVDTTGAGDILAGAFLSLWVRNISPEHALKEAVEIATASVTDFGVDHDLVSEMIREKRGKISLRLPGQPRAIEELL